MYEGFTFVSARIETMPDFRFTLEQAVHFGLIDALTADKAVKYMTEEPACSGIQMEETGDWIYKAK